MRLHVGPDGLGPAPAPGQTLDLPPGPARHLQVLRAQPGDRVEVFDGLGRAWAAEVQTMQRQAVAVRLLAEATGPSPELRCAVGLAVVMPANDRMDFLVEKATELGAAVLQPLVSERSVLRLAGDRAQRKVSHWAGVAAGAAEQCGRRVVPQVRAVQPLAAFLQSTAAASGVVRLVLHPEAAAPAGASPPFRGARPDGPDGVAAHPAVWLLSGPEGGLTSGEVALARQSGFEPVSLGPRVLRADTAPLAWLAHLGQVEAAGT